MSNTDLTTVLSGPLDQWLDKHLGHEVTYTHSFKNPGFAAEYPRRTVSGELRTRLHSHFAATGEGAAILITPRPEEVRIISLTETEVEYTTYPNAVHEGRVRMCAA